MMQKSLLIAAALLGANAASAQSVNYQCMGGKSANVQYWFGEATATAKIRLDGRLRTLHYAAESNADTTVYAQGPYRLSVENVPDVRKAKGLMVFKNGFATVNGKRTKVARILFKGCDPVQAAQPARPAANAADLDDAPIKAYTAFGRGGAAWRAVVDRDRLSLEGPSIQTATIAVERSAYAKGVEFSGQAGKRAVGLNINGTPCKDDQGQRHEFTATLSYGSKTYKGCAVRGATPIAPT